MSTPVATIGGVLADLLNPWSWSEHTLAVLTALGTTGAVIALVVVETTKDWLGRHRHARTQPDLRLTHDANVDVAREVATVGQTPTGTAFVRLGVENAAGRRAASAVEVTVKRVDRIEGPRFSNLPPTTHNIGPLGWTHRDPVNNQLGPGVRRTVVLGAIAEDSSPFQVGLGIPPPNSGVDILPPGTYRFTLTLSATDVDARDWTLQLWHDGELTRGDDARDHVRIAAGPKPT